jgi:integrase
VTRPRLCATCGVQPVAYGGRQFCYDCVPRVWKRPARCKRCGSTRDYFTAGLCRQCHRSGPWVDGCLDCQAWGVTRHHQWLCEACRGWRRRYGAPQRCPSCQRQVVVNDRGYCRLCCRVASLSSPGHQVVDVVAGNRDGQQLFFADMILKKRKTPTRPGPAAADPPLRWPAGYPVTHRQLVLIACPRDLRRVIPLPAISPLAAALDRAVDTHAATHGWRSSLRISTARGIRVLLAAQDTPGAPITTSEALALTDVLNCTVQPVLEVLAGVGMLDDDRDAPLESWFVAKTERIAGPMATELRPWFEALRDGSTITPRTRARSIETVRHRVAAVVEALEGWTTAGHQSLREITRQDVIDVLPNVAHRRRQVLDSLRSLFRFLKARRTVFVNPTARMRSEPVQPNYPLPIDLEMVREAINSTEPARAAMAALVAFHAVRTGHLRDLQLSDIRDGRLFLPDRTVVMADAVRDRLAAWLIERARRWPSTVNPHLFISQYTAVRIGPVSRQWISATNRLHVQAIREDRILHEAMTTGGDVRRLGDLFGLSVGGTERYAHTENEPGAFNPA